VQFLPNPYAQYGAEESWKDFCSEVAEKKEWNLSDLIPKSDTNQETEDVEALDL
jgi:hypothetical protein